MRFKNTYITIETKLFNNLEQEITKHNLYYGQDDNNKIMMDKAVFLIDHIQYQKGYRKDDVTSGGYIRIPSKFLNDYLQKELKKYKDFLIRYNYIKVIPYDKETGKSYGYKVVFSDNNNSANELNEYQFYKFLSITYEKFLSNAIEKNIQIERKKNSADRTTKHLTKWINEDEIQIDWRRAFKYVYASKELEEQQKEQYYHSLNRIRFHQWYYLRSTKDNRLHSNLTNLPSSLRMFLSHKGQRLVSLDIKSSQPFILAGVFNLIVRNERDRLDTLRLKLRSKDVIDKLGTVMNSISLEPVVVDGFKAYINLVCEKDIYNHVAHNLSTAFISSIKRLNGYVDKFYNPKSNIKETKLFKDLRSYCKVLALEYMYCSIESYDKRLKEIRRIYPDAINQFIREFKYCKELETPKMKRTKRQREKITKSKKLFSKFLQQLESLLMLDIITKEFSKIYPDVFMATIHDCIVVPKKYEIEVKEFLQKRLFEILGIKAEIKSEDW